MLLELHSHTSKHSSCSTIDPITIVKQTVLKGLQGIIITEHNYLWSDEELNELRKKAEISENFLILSAQEVQTDMGHILIYGADKSITDKISLSSLREQYPDAAVIWAHPFRNGFIPEKGKLFNPLLDAIEIFSSNQTHKENYLGLKLWHEYKFTATSGSDTHDNERIAILPSQFDHPVNNINDVVTELRAGRVRPFFKEIPRSGSHLIVTEVTFGTKGEDEERNRIIIKKISNTAKWEKEKLSVDINKAIYEKGFNSTSKYRVPQIIDISPKENLVIEEGQRGKNLFEVLLNTKSDAGLEYFKLTAKWLARLHNAKLKLTTKEDSAKREMKRFESYKNVFISTNSPFKKKALEAIEFVKIGENALFAGPDAGFVQCHGDFHPKNIIIGFDKTHDPSTLFVSVIDFNNSIVMPPEFDVGYFLAQFKAQFDNYPKIQEKYKDSTFLKAYQEESSAALKSGFKAQVELFKLRAQLSIASFYIKVGKGESFEMDELISKIKTT
ncbi:MAG: phosphotransferase [Elusimicrobia bacterium]|nr:phosphotransferase [Candidatus Liberimonas magnetica]